MLSSFFSTPILRLVRVKKTRRRTHYDVHVKAARALIHERVACFAPLCGVSIKRIAIRNQKRCWGSCSSLGNLNFNYKLLFLPACQRDYIIVHELCHLIELNHSEKFWLHVQRVCPDYKKITTQLRRLEKETGLQPQKIVDCAITHSCEYCAITTVV